MEPRRMGGEVLTALSNALVSLHRHHYGRGPGAAKSYVVDDMVICVLTDIYTQVERTLIDAGKLEHVREARQLHQLALGDDYRAAAEEATGRKVIAFVSSVHFDPDSAFEVFLLEPPYEADGDGSSRKSSTE